MKLILNIMTEDSEFLDQIEVEVTEDKLYPIGTSLARADMLSEIESVARVVQAREAAIKAAMEDS